jgi:hypothetical protein
VPLEDEGVPLGKETVDDAEELPGTTADTSSLGTALYQTVVPSKSWRGEGE